MGDTAFSSDGRWSFQMVRGVLGLLWYGTLGQTAVLWLIPVRFPNPSNAR